MELNPCMKHHLVRKTVREFAEDCLRPIAAESDHEARFPKEAIEKMRPLNYFGLQAPPEYGGAGLDSISYAIAIEEISRVAAGVGLCVTVHNSVALNPILQFGNEEQKKRWATALATGERIGSIMPSARSRLIWPVLGSQGRSDTMGTCFTKTTMFIRLTP